MISRYGMLVGGLVLCASPATLDAQGVENELGGMEWKLQNLRPSGQPVIPLFDGYHQIEDGTYDFCFGYFNMNLDEVIDIPIGEDNFIEPARFDGMQPTHFLQVPERNRRYFCVFTVNVPQEFAEGEERVVWTLRYDGQTYSVPGHKVSVHYVYENLEMTTGRVAPVLRFVEPSSGEGRGRSGPTAGPVTTRVNEPLPVTISVTPPEGIDPKAWRVLWSQHQGPGRVTFSPEETRLEEGQTEATTAATFTEPGEYLLRLQAVDGAFSDHCCWTNGFVEVTVTQ